MVNVHLLVLVFYAWWLIIYPSQHTPGLPIALKTKLQERRWMGGCRSASLSSVVRAPVAKARGPGFNSLVCVSSRV